MKLAKWTLAVLAVCLVAMPATWAQESKVDKNLVEWDRHNTRAKSKVRVANPTTGGKVYVRMPLDPKNLNPFSAATGVYAQRVYGYIFSSLLTRDGWSLKWQMTEPSKPAKMSDAEKAYFAEYDRMRKTMSPIVHEFKPNTNSLATAYEINDLIILKEGKKKIIGKYKRKGANYIMTTKDGKEMTIKRDDVFEARPNVVYTFLLRRDAKFHDGKPLTGHDVVFSFAVVKNKHVNAASYRSYFGDVEDWYLPNPKDPYTVQFIYAKPYWYALTIMSGLPIIPEHFFGLEKFGAGKDAESRKKVAYTSQRFGKFYNDHPTWGDTKLVGSGPYKLGKWTKGSQISMLRNKEYWGPTAYIDEVVWRYISNDTAALQEIKNGKLDFDSAVPTNIFLENAKGAQFDSGELVKATYFYPAYSYLGWNMRRELFKDRQVRQALTYLFPREKILKNVLKGMGKIITGPFYFYGPVYDKRLKPRPFDATKAKELLTKAGWGDTDGDGILDKGGKKFTFDILFVASSPATQEMAELYKEELRKVGIIADLRKFKWAAMLGKVNGWEFDAVFLGWGSVVEGDPYQLWHSSGAKVKKSSNHVGYANKRVDRIIERGRKMFNVKKRRRYYRRMHRILYYDQPYTFLYTLPRKTVYHNRIRGIRWVKPRPGWDIQEWYIPKELQKN